MDIKNLTILQMDAQLLSTEVSELLGYRLAISQEEYEKSEVFKMKKEVIQGYKNKVDETFRKLYKE